MDRPSARPHDRPLFVRLSDDERRALDALAMRLGVTYSDAVRLLLRASERLSVDLASVRP